MCQSFSLRGKLGHPEIFRRDCRSLVDLLQRLEVNLIIVIIAREFEKFIPVGGQECLLLFLLGIEQRSSRSFSLNRGPLPKEPYTVSKLQSILSKAASHDDLTQITPSTSILLQPFGRYPKIFQENYILKVPDRDMISGLLFQMTCSHPSVEAIGEPRIRLCFLFQPLTVA